MLNDHRSPFMKEHKQTYTQFYALTKPGVLKKPTYDKIIKKYTNMPLLPFHDIMKHNHIRKKVIDEDAFRTNEPPHGKTSNLSRRKQRRRSASQ